MMHAGAGLLPSASKENLLDRNPRRG